MPWRWLILGIICSAIGDWFSKKWADQGHWTSKVVVLAAYLTATLAWLVVVGRQKHLATCWITWTICAAAVMLCVSASFGERMTRPQLLGVVFGLIAVLLINHE